MARRGGACIAVVVHGACRQAGNTKESGPIFLLHGTPTELQNHGYRIA